MAEKAIKFRLFLNRISIKAEKYRHQAIQRQKYQKFGHLTRKYKSNHKCQIYTEEHPTKAHKYDICAGWATIPIFRVDSRVDA